MGLLRQAQVGCFSALRALLKFGLSTIDHASTHLVCAGGFPVFGILKLEQIPTEG